MVDDRHKHQRFDKLFTENVKQVTAFALRRVHAEDAKDVVSRTFTVAWRRLDDVPPEPLPWLIGVARNILLEQRRSDQRRTALEVRLTDAARIGHNRDTDVADALIAQVAIRNALLRLRSSDRDVLTIVAWEGLNTSELATALGCTKATASLRLHRARRRFAKYLEADGSATAPSSTDPIGLSLPSTAKEIR